MQHEHNVCNTTDNLGNGPHFVKGGAGLLAKSAQDKEMRRRVAEWLRAGMAAAAASGGAVSQSALAKLSGVSRETINNLLHERVETSEETLHKLATALGSDLPTGGRPTVREVVREPSVEPYRSPEPASGPGAAQQFYDMIQARMIQKMGTGETVTASEAAGYLAALWRIAVTECPALAVTASPGAPSERNAMEAVKMAHQHQARSGTDRRQA